MFENKHSVSMKSRRRFLHLSSFSDSNSFMTVGPDLRCLKATLNPNKQTRRSLGPADFVLDSQDIGPVYLLCDFCPFSTMIASF